ncbi:hypothetical protein CBR_g48210 [Chara braunii]|uniref:protein disulfide-isomerase n=1 Tax=Chara braunii TaxID=69332 RepID=A0A388M268_CHABU|nr:hypothetical protein CBR_g48210 [Chara braunii]|eukprot:GBG88678.1 hypothetical protein CBR_g48210 [Chara braunii]
MDAPSMTDVEFVCAGSHCGCDSMAARSLRHYHKAYGRPGDILTGRSFAGLPTDEKIDAVHGGKGAGSERWRHLRKLECVGKEHIGGRDVRVRDPNRRGDLVLTLNPESFRGLQCGNAASRRRGHLRRLQFVEENGHVQGRDAHVKDLWHDGKRVQQWRHLRKLEYVENAHALGKDVKVRDLNHINPVLNLNPDSFAGLRRGDKALLVNFYSTTCKMCKELEPTYSALARHVLKDPSFRLHVIIAKLDADMYKTRGTLQRIRVFPTIKFLPRGGKHPKEYDGESSLASFLSFLEGQLRLRNFGRVYQFDLLAREFYEAPSDPKRIRVFEKMEGQAASVKEKDDVRKCAMIYTDIMRKSLEYGLQYIQEEYQRVDRLLAVHMPANEYDEVLARKNILQGFTSDAQIG